MPHIVADKDTYFIIPALSMAGFVKKGQNITTPHEVEQFDNEAKWQARKDELGIQDVEPEDVEQEDVEQEPLQ